MAQTALDTVNAVLRRLRENVVTSTSLSTSTYGQLILQFVNDTKREVEDAWNWTFLRTVLTVTTSAGTNAYTLTGAGRRYRFYDDQKKIYNATQKTYIWPVNQAYFDLQTYLTSAPNGLPYWYRLRGADSSGDPTLELYQTPDNTYSLRVPLVIPDADLVAATDTFRCPQNVIVHGAWARAISERGEDGGQNTSEQWQLYQMALGDAIAQDAERVTADETTWTV